MVEPSGLPCRGPARGSDGQARLSEPQAGLLRLRLVTTATIAAAIALAAGSATAGAPSTGADKNCSDVYTNQQAQQYFDSHGGSPSTDVDGLDRDHDGIACEDLPSGGGITLPPPPATVHASCSAARTRTPLHSRQGSRQRDRRRALRSRLLAGGPQRPAV